VPFSLPALPTDGGSSIMRAQTGVFGSRQKELLYKMFRPEIVDKNQFMMEGNSDCDEWYVVSEQLNRLSATRNWC
jgi:hypothetical protein